MNLPDDIIIYILNNFIYEINDYYNAIINNYQNNEDIIKIIINLSNISNINKKFKNFIKKIINNDFILFNLYELGLTLDLLTFITKYFKILGYNFNKLSFDNNTLLFYLIDNYYYYKPINTFYNEKLGNFIKLLINFGIDINTINLYGNTILNYHLSLIDNDFYDFFNDTFDYQYSFLEYINIYADYNADFNFKNNNNDTPLHTIIKICEKLAYNQLNNISYYQKLNNILYKIIHKININIQNNDGFKYIDLLIKDKEQLKLIKNLII